MTSTRLVACAVLLVASGCALPSLDGALVRCDVDADCPTPQQCVTDLDGQKLCREAGDPCTAVVDGVARVLPDGSACDGGICFERACVAPACGDGVITVPEGCDDGVDNSDAVAGACRSDCRPARCGDGVLDPEEGCDDGASNSDTVANACRTTCIAAVCGDGVVDGGEGCDDGVANSDTRAGACRTACRLAACGDGVRDLDEECDDGERNNDAVAGACRTDCDVAACGDGVIDSGEVCDDGNRDSGDGCRADCVKTEVCGDGIVDLGEACDDGNTNTRDGCRACRLTSWNPTVAIAGRSGGRDALLTAPRGVAIDAVGGIYVADTGGHRVLRVDPACLPCADDDECAACSVDVIAGTGVAGFDGDGGPAALAELRGPSDVVISGDGRIFIADTLNDRVRVVDTNGTISTFVGGADNPTGDGDGLIGRFVRLRSPRGLGLGGNLQRFLLVAEDNGGRIRAISAIAQASTLVGGGDQRDLPDGAGLTAGTLRSPVDVAEGASGIFITEAGAGRIRRVSSGVISTVAGGVTAPDVAAPPAPGALALSVALEGLASIAFDGLTPVFAEQASRRVWRLNIDGTLSVVAGNGDTSPLEDGPAATRGLGRPAGLAVGDGQIVFSDEVHHVVRNVALSANGDESRRALGNIGVEGAPAVGANATSFTIGLCVGLAELQDGAILIADSDGRRLYRRGVDGILSVVAGTGEVGIVDRGIVGAVAANVPMTPLALLQRANGLLAVLVDRPGTGLTDLVEIDDSGLVVRVVLEVAGTGSKSGRFGMAESPDGRLHIVGDDTGIAVEAPLDTFVVLGDELGLGGFGAIAISPEGRIVLVDGSGAVSEFVSDDDPPIELRSGQAVAIVFRNGRLIISDLETGIVDAGPLPDGGPLRSEVSVVLRADARIAGDGGPATAASVREVKVMASAGERLLLSDESARLIRRIDETGTILTVAGDLHPSGPGRFAQAALYGPTTLLAFGDGSLVSHGASRRVLEVRPDEDGNDGTVTVIYGHPGAVSGSPLAALRPLLSGDTAVFTVPTLPDTFGLTTNSRIAAVTRQTPGNWDFQLGVTVVGNQLTSIVALDDEIVAASFRNDHCVKALPGDDEPLFGTCDTAGSFDGFTSSPGALAVAPTGALYVADVGNNRVLRRDPLDGTVTIVIGDGSPSSAGRGAPARIFPVHAPGQLAVDNDGNLYVASTTTVRLVSDTNGSGDADGDDTVDTIFPSASGAGLGLGCLQSLTLAVPTTGGPGHDRLWVGDACAGALIRLDLADR